MGRQLVGQGQQAGRAALLFAFLKQVSVLPYSQLSLKPWNFQIKEETSSGEKHTLYPIF